MSVRYWLCTCLQVWGLGDSCSDKQRKMRSNWLHHFPFSRISTFWSRPFVVFQSTLHRVQILIAVFWYLCEHNGLLKVQGWGPLKFSSNICTKMMGSSVSAVGFEEVFIILKWEEAGLWLQVDTDPQLFGQLSCSSLGQMPRKLKYLSKDFIWNVSSCRIRPEKMKNDSTLLIFGQFCIISQTYSFFSCSWAILMRVSKCLDFFL